MSRRPCDLARFSHQPGDRQAAGRCPNWPTAAPRLGVAGVGLWREPVQAYGVEAAARLVRDAGLTVTTLCRGGFFTAIDPAERAAALDDNRARHRRGRRRWAPDTLVLVSGGLPGRQPRPARRPGAHRRRAGASWARTPRSAACGWRSSRCTRCTPPTAAWSPPSAQALDLAERFPAEQVGVVVDTYHLWWDDRCAAQIARAGAGGRIHAFQLADWITPLPEGVLLGRGQLGDGSVDLRVPRAGRGGRLPGPIEVEMFNPALWARDGARCSRRRPSATSGTCCEDSMAAGGRRALCGPPGNVT